MIIIAIISILLITGASWIIREILGIKRICPICVGVSGTWLWMIIAQILGFRMDVLVIGILLGGSVVGIAYQLAKRVSESKSLALKIIVIPLGFFAAYNLATLNWTVFLISLAVIVVAIFGFWKVSIQHDPEEKKQVVKELEDKMKNCC